MSPSRDEVGLVSFGNNGATDITTYSFKIWVGDDTTNADTASYISDHYPGNPATYAGYATLDLPLSYDHGVVDAAIEGLVPCGGTPMRYGLFEAGRELIDNSNPEAVRAIILLTDGDWNDGGNPEGGGSAVSLPIIGQESVIDWIGDNDIKIYTIRLGTSGNVGDLTSYAEKTGGTYYSAPSAEDLNGIYLAIAGDLKTTAGVDTTMDIIFTGLEVNNVTYPEDPGDIIEYVYQDGASTTIESWNLTHTIIPKYTIDQGGDWNSVQGLTFSTAEIGTIHLNQTWETHFLLRMLEGGNINLFGPGSKICFDNGTQMVSLPDTYVTVVPNLTATGVNFKSLAIENFRSPNRDSFTDTLRLAWELNYTGEYPVKQLLRYQRDGGPCYVEFKQLTAQLPFISPLPCSAGLDVRYLDPGLYRIWIIARAVDAPEDLKYLDGWIRIGNEGENYILIE